MRRIVSVAAAFTFVLIQTGVADAKRPRNEDQEASRAAQQTKQDSQQTKQDRAKLDNPKLPEQERKDIEQRIADRGAQVDERVNQFPDSTAVAAAGVDYALNDRNVPKANQLGDKAVENAQKSGDPEDLVEAYKARAQARVAGGDKAAALADITAALELKKDDADLQRLHGLIAGHAPAKGYKPPSKGFGEGDLAAKEKAGGMGAHGGAGQQPGGGASEAATTAPQQAALQQQAQATAAQLEKQRAVERAAEGLGMDPRGARGKLDEVLKGDPKNAAAWALRAKADRLIGEYQAAHGDASTAIGLNPTLAMAYAERALAGIALGYSTADYLADWEKVGKLDPGVASTYSQAFEAAMAARGGYIPASKAAELAARNTLGAKAKRVMPWIGVLFLLAAAGAGKWAYGKHKESTTRRKARPADDVTPTRR